MPEPDLKTVLRENFPALLHVIVAMKRAHAAHPESRAINVLHERADRLIAPLKQYMDEDQLAELSTAAVPKSPPPNPDE